MFNVRQLIAATLLLSCAFGAQAERLKDIASISGVRSNQLIGYGLVVGLNGTGDQTTQTPFTLQTFNNMLSQFGIKVPAGSGNVQLKNVAAVSVHADLPAFINQARWWTLPCPRSVTPEPARRQPADDPAQGYRWQRLCRGPG